MSGPRRRTSWSSRRSLAGCLLVSSVLAGTAGGASSAFTATAQSAGNSFTVPADTAAPTVQRATVSRSAAESPGVVRQGGGYYAYADVSDARSGVDTVVADTSSFHTGTTAAPLSTAGGPWTVAGQSYTHRSGLLQTTTPQRTGATRPWTVRAVDRVGNTATPAYSAVLQRYRDVVLATTGVTRYHPLSDGAVSADEFTISTSTSLAGRTGSLDETWSSGTGSIQVIPSGGGRIRTGDVAAASAVSGAVPPSADYAVEADVAVQTLLAGSAPGVLGRFSGSDPSQSFYQLRYLKDADAFELWRQDAGARTRLASYGQTLAAGGTYRMRLQMNGSSIRVFIDGQLRVDVSDSSISAAGQGGVVFGHGGSTARPTDTTGMHLDNFRLSTLTTAAADLQGAGSAGTYVGGPRLNQPGAIVGDTDRATRFDGIDDAMVLPRPGSTKNDMSAELWFASSNGGRGTGASPEWWRGAGLLDADEAGRRDDYGLSLLADGRIAFGGGDGDVDVTGYSGAGYADGAWHHVVLTRTASSGRLTLYVDGVERAQVTAGTGELPSSGPGATLTVGGINSGDGFLSGSVDDVAVYATTLPPATVADHFAAGRGTG